MSYIYHQMGLRDLFKKKDTKETTPEKTPKQLREQSLLDFALEHGKDKFTVQRPPAFKLMPDFLKSIMGDKLAREAWRYMANPKMFTTADVKHDGDWYSNYISQVPAEYVGGKEGETRYYGGSGSHPLRNQARDYSKKVGDWSSYWTVGDSIPAAKAMELERLWKNK